MATSGVQDDEVGPDLTVLRGMPPRFTDQSIVSPMAHILSFADYLESHKVTNEDQKILRFAMSLGGKVRIWMESQEFASFEDLKKEFLDYCWDMSHEPRVHVLQNMRLEADETAQEYIIRIQECVRGLGYSPDMIKAQFLSGLPEELWKQVKSMRDSSIGEMGEMVQMLMDLTRIPEKKESQ